MNELNLKSKEFEAKYRRREELANKDTIKGEEYEELRDLTNFVTEFKVQHEKAEQEYETHLKNEARVSRMVAERVFANKTSLSTVLDELITENAGRKAALEYISKRTAQRNENTHRLPEDAAKIAAENRFFTLSQERDLFEESRTQSLLMKEHSLLAEMEHISMRIGQENTLVDGMNYKIQLLDNDIKLRLRQIQNLSMLKNVMLSRGKRLETTYVSLKNESASHNNTLKRRIRAEMNSLQSYAAGLEETDSNLKKEINKEYETLIRNRMQMKKLKLESDKQKEILGSQHLPAGNRQHPAAPVQRMPTLGQNGRPDSAYPSPPQKSAREIQQFHRTVWELRPVLYQIHPELRERPERASRHHDDAVSEKSHLEQPLERRFTKSPTNLSVSHEMYSRQPTNQSEGVYLQAPNTDAESVDSFRTVRVSEIEHILKFFNGDTEALQDSVINELDRLGLHYGDQRYQLLSMHSLLEFKKDLLKDYQIKRDRAKAADETPLLNRLDEHPIADFRIQMTQALEKKDLDNKFTTWKTSYNVGIYNTLKLKLINLVRKFAGWTESILKVATGYSLSKRVYDLHQEIEEVAARNADKFEFDLDKITQMKHDLSQFSKESVENQLFFDWMLTNEWFFMVFSHKQELAELLKYCKGRLLPEDTLIKLVEKSWVYYNDFLDDNVRILSKSIKEFMFVLDRQREQVAAQGLLSSARSTSKLSSVPNLLGVLRSNGVIYHDFNFNDYVASLFAEDEHIDPDIIMVPIDPEPAPIEKKELVEVEPQKLMTPAQIEMEKMKQLITKVSKDKDTEVRSLEFKSHFVDFMKSINQSYGILKTGLSTDRKAGNEDASTTHLGTEVGRQDTTSSGLSLFKKLRVKTAKNHVSSKIDSGLASLKQPRAATAAGGSRLDIIVGSGRDVSRGRDNVLQTQPFDFRTRRGSSIDRLKRNRLLSKLNESSSLGNYGQESDSRVNFVLNQIRVRSMTAERSRSNDRSNSREVLGKLTRKLDHTSINFRARLQRAELNSTTDSFTDIRKPRAHLASSFFDQDPFLPSYSFRNSKLAY